MQLFGGAASFSTTLMLYTSGCAHVRLAAHIYCLGTANKAGASPRSEGATPSSDAVRAGIQTFYSEWSPYQVCARTLSFLWPDSIRLIQKRALTLFSQYTHMCSQYYMCAVRCTPCWYYTHDEVWSGQHHRQTKTLRPRSRRSSCYLSPHFDQIQIISSSVCAWSRHWPLSSLSQVCGGQGTSCPESQLYFKNLYFPLTSTNTSVCVIVWSIIYISLAHTTDGSVCGFQRH